MGPFFTAVTAHVAKLSLEPLSLFYPCQVDAALFAFKLGGAGVQTRRKLYMKYCHDCRFFPAVAKDAESQNDFVNALKMSLKKDPKNVP